MIDKELDNEELGIEMLCKEAGMSQAQLYRKLKALTNLSIKNFMNEHRLRRAFEMLQDSTRSVKEVAYLTGFVDPSYFSRVFMNKYGFPPSKVAKK